MFTITPNGANLPTVQFGSVELPFVAGMPLHVAADRLRTTVERLQFSVRPDNGSWHRARRLELRAGDSFGETRPVAALDAKDIPAGIVDGPEPTPEFAAAVLEAAAADRWWPEMPDPAKPDNRERCEVLRKLFGQHELVGWIDQLAAARAEARVAERTAGRRVALLRLTGRPRVSFDDLEACDDTTAARLAVLALNSWPNAELRGALYYLTGKRDDFDTRLDAMLAARPAFAGIVRRLEEDRFAFDDDDLARSGAETLVRAFDEPLWGVCQDLSDRVARDVAFRVHVTCDIGELEGAAPALHIWSDADIDAAIAAGHAGDRGSWLKLAAAVVASSEEALCADPDRLDRVVSVLPQPFKIIAVASPRGDRHRTVVFDSLSRVQAATRGRTAAAR